jgi:hypothetical protein
MARKPINYGTTAGDGTGDILFTSFKNINDNFIELYKISGWGYYADALTTPTIVVNTSYTQITIDALGSLTNETYLPGEIRGSGHLWAGSKVTPISLGDDYDGRLDVTVTAKSGSPALMDVILDISGGVAGANKIYTGYIQTGGTVPYDQSLYLDFFTLATAVTNGAKIYAKVDSGSITIGRRNIKLSRKSKGGL